MLISIGGFSHFISWWKLLDRPKLNIFSLISSYFDLIIIALLQFWSQEISFGMVHIVLCILEMGVGVDDTHRRKGVHTNNVPNFYSHSVLMVR